MFLGVNLVNLIDNNSTSIQVMACCLAGNKPLPEPVLTLFHL